MKHLSSLSFVAVGLTVLCHTAAAQSPPESLRACARLPDSTERLHCYDTQMAAMGVAVATPAPGAVAPPAPSPTPAAPAAPAVAAAPSAATAPPVATTAAPPSPQDKFGEEEIKSQKKPKEKAADRVMTSTISSIKQVKPKLWIIVLANGQIWMQDGTTITNFFKAGYDAHIEKGMLGDYRMSTEQTGEGNMVRVTRIQ